jgi:hypothetical protein
MPYRSTRIGIDGDTCRRLHRLHRQTGIPVRKLVNAFLRGCLDTTLGRRVRPRSKHRGRLR